MNPKRKPNALVDLAQVERELNDLFSETFGLRKTGRTYPKLDAYRDGSDFIVEACVPFCRREDLSVELERNDLVIRGQVAAEHSNRAPTDRTTYLKELVRSSFERAISLDPGLVKAWDKTVTATLSDGILRVTLKGFMETKSPESNSIPIPIQ